MSVQNPVAPALLMGFVGLCASRKGMFSLLCLAITLCLAWIGKLNIPVATTITGLQAVFCACHSYVNGKAIQSSSEVQKVIATINQVKDKI